MKLYLAPCLISAFIALTITACGSDDKSSTPVAEEKDYQGFVPKFAPAYLTNAATLSQDDCSTTADLINRSPRGTEHSKQSALELIQNIQAHLISRNCITRQRIFSQPATIKTTDAETLVTSNLQLAQELNTWQTLPSAQTSTAANINTRGYSVSTGTSDNRRHRIDILRAADGNGGSTKILRSLRQWDNVGTRDIRAALIIQVHDNSGKITEQKISARIAADNALYLISAAIKPGLGALTYLKKCDQSTANSNDYLRECTSSGDWEVKAYNAQGAESLSEITALLTTLKISGTSLAAQAASILPEQKFYSGQSESEFFSERSFSVLLKSVPTTTPTAPTTPTTPGETLPAVASVTATGSGDSISVNWPAVSGATFYVITRQKTGDARPTIIPPVSTTNYSDNGLSSGEYRYFITACKSTTSCSLPAASSAVNI